MKSTINKGIALAKIFRNLQKRKLVKIAIARGEASLAKKGAIVVETGIYTGRSPDDRFIVKRGRSDARINWGKINQPISTDHFRTLKRKVDSYLKEQEDFFQTDGFICADRAHKLHVRIFSEFAYQALFSSHILINGNTKELENHEPDLTVYVAPNLRSNPSSDGTNSEAFIVLNLEKKTVLIGGTKYAGEIKKSIFTFLNYILPQKGVFPMHCAANVSKNGDSALFFGLSGTGKTTLSSDPDRFLIGDDEHGWSKDGIFNFEGGCYAKCINLKKEKEPQVFAAIKDGAVVENVVLNAKGELCFDDDSLTENTRAAYPLSHIKNSLSSGESIHPKNIIFLTADATGVLPAIAHLNNKEAIYYFLSGYTSKLAGTECGIIKPKPTFSACFGAPFMPYRPEIYAKLLKDKLMRYFPKVYLVNTGWFGGPYGIGQRISISETRAIIKTILSNKLKKTKFIKEPVFGLNVPVEVDGVNEKLLKPRLGWRDLLAYDQQARKLKKLFDTNARFLDKLKK